MKPTHLDLFSGIGGFALAAQWAGFQTIGFSEVDKYACKILEQNWKGIPNYGDIRNITGRKLPSGLSLLTGGFPCQPYSQAGLQKGKDDDRNLWPEMLRVISECKPTWVLGENVTGIIEMELDNVLSDMERLGYETTTLVLPAACVGAYHFRDRVWIVGNSNISRSHPSGESELEGVRNREEKEIQQSQGSSDASSDVADSISASERSSHRSSVRRGIGFGQEQDISEGSEVGSDIANSSPDVSNSGIKRSQGYWNPQEPDTQGWEAQNRHLGESCSLGSRAQWQSEPELGRVANGIPNRTHRIKAIGNAIVPQVAYEILRVMITMIEPDQEDIGL